MPIPQSHARRRIVKRAPEGTPVYASDGQAVSTQDPGNQYAKNVVSSSTAPSTIGLAVVLAICLVAFISGCVYWRVKKRRSRNSNGNFVRGADSILFGSDKSPATSSFGRNSANLEKPDKAFIPSPFPYENTGWVPQIRNYRGVPVKDGELPGHVKAARDGKRWLNSLSKETNEKERVTPPPSYKAANGGTDRSSADSNDRRIPPIIPLPPTPDENDKSHPPTPPTPPASKKLTVATLKVEAPPASRFSMSPLPKTAGFEPLPSPARSTSFANPLSPNHATFSTKKLSSVFKSGGLPLPRLMSVINTFQPSLEDEMLVTIGDTVRLLEEYNDGWCLVQRIGKPDAPRGVVPRFCLVERQSTTPVSSSRRNLIKSIQASARKF